MINIRIYITVKLPVISSLLYRLPHPNINVNLMISSRNQPDRGEWR